MDLSYFMAEFDNLEPLCLKIIDMLPEDPAVALTCFSMIVDMWSWNNNRKSSETWTELYEVAMRVHDIMGDCK